MSHDISITLLYLQEDNQNCFTLFCQQDNTVRPSTVDNAKSLGMLHK